MFDDAPDRRNTVTALDGQLSDGIAFDNPALEPDALALEFVDGIFPTKAATALAAKPALGSVPAVSIASDP
jgi:hypothetical protein